MNLTCCIKLFDFAISATTSPSGKQINIFEKKLNEVPKVIKNQNARFSESNNIDFWYRKINMAETYFLKIEQSILLEMTKMKRNT